MDKNFKLVQLFKIFFICCKKDTIIPSVRYYNFFVRGTPGSSEYE